MTMNSSGPISLAGTTAGVSIEIENGGNGTTQISLNDAAVRSLAGVPSGAITMPTNFYGKANQFTFTISASQNTYCIRAGAVSAGWNGSSKLVVNINSGVILSATSTGNFGAYIQGSFPGGLTVNNSGTIVGAGGNGGNGGGISPCLSYFIPPGNGAGGGGALYVRSSTTFNNAGVIAGGGGGGGGGNQSYVTAGGGGGGGRSSNAVNSPGGTGATSGYCIPRAGNGGSGTYGGPGGGGLGQFYNYNCCGTDKNSYGGTGGGGGGWGASGGTGTTGGCCTRGGPGSGAGGGGGKATCGAGTYITWSATGTRYGSIS